MVKARLRTNTILRVVPRRMVRFLVLGIISRVNMVGGARVAFRVTGRGMMPEVIMVVELVRMFICRQVL